MWNSHFAPYAVLNKMPYRGAFLPKAMANKHHTAGPSEIRRIYHQSSHLALTSPVTENIKLMLIVGLFAGVFSFVGALDVVFGMVNWNSI